MDISDFLKVVSEESFLEYPLDPGKVDIHEIMNISDTKTLKSLCAHSVSLKKLALTKAWLPNNTRQEVLGKVDVLNRFIADLRKHTCYCTRYKYLSPDPMWEQDDQRIEIEKFLNYEKLSEYKCRCKNCSKQFVVAWGQDSMGYDDYQWKEN